MKAKDCFTKFILLRRCINCWHTNEASAKKCSQCSMTFIGEASENEKMQAIEEIDRRKEIRKNHE